MKHLKTYENIYSPYKQKQENIKNSILGSFIIERNRIYELTREYINTYITDYNGQINARKITRIEFPYYKWSSSWGDDMEIFYRDHREHKELDIRLSKTETEELIAFIENSDLFKSMRKYNL